MLKYNKETEHIYDSGPLNMNSETQMKSLGQGGAQEMVHHGYSIGLDFGGRHRTPGTY